MNLINTVEDPAHTYHVSALGLFERWSGENVIDLYNQAGDKKELTGSYEKADPMGQGFVRLSVKMQGAIMPWPTATAEYCSHRRRAFDG